MGMGSLNVANELAARQMLTSCGISRLTPTHDLNAQQLQDLAAALGQVVYLDVCCGCGCGCIIMARGVVGILITSLATNALLSHPVFFFYSVIPSPTLQGATLPTLQTPQPLERLLTLQLTNPTPQPLAQSLEAIVHQHLPIFHTEHCVFCRFLSEGDNYTNCGHPCETNTVHLRDERGSDHLVLADMGCRNTVFNAQAQSGAFYLPALLGAGFRSFRLELVDEPGGQVAALLDGYRDVLQGRQTPGDLWSYLRSIPDAKGEPQGVEAGSLKHTRAEANSRPQDREGLKKTAAQSGKWSKMNRAPIRVEG